MKKDILFTLPSYFRDDMNIYAYRFGKGEKTCAVVGALRGNEVQQLYVCARLIAYLREIDGKSAVPVLTKPAAVRRLDGGAAKVFALGASAHDVYTLQNVTNSDKKCGRDWRNGPVIV